MNSVICSVFRGNLIESRHTVECVVMDSTNKTIFSTTAKNTPYCLRSTLKPFQFAAAINSGVLETFPFSNKEIAVMCASHHGQPQHVQAVKKILKTIGLSKNDLECGFHFPLDKKSKALIHKDPKQKSAIYNNCSGKHSGILAFLKHKNYIIKNYIKHSHPIHKHIIDYIEMIAEKKATEYAVDGCSLPTPYFPLKTLCRMYLQLVKETEKKELNIIKNAMQQHPEMVAGERGFDSWFMKKISNSIAKGGAEGMRAISIDTKEYGPIAMAIKVQDGNHRASEVASIEILKKINAISNSEYESLIKEATYTLKNLNGIKTGQISCEIKKQQTTQNKHEPIH